MCNVSLESQNSKSKNKQNIQSVKTDLKKNPNKMFNFITNFVIQSVDNY